MCVCVHKYLFTCISITDNLYKSIILVLIIVFPITEESKLILLNSNEVVYLIYKCVYVF